MSQNASFNAYSEFDGTNAPRAHSRLSQSKSVFCVLTMASFLKSIVNSAQDVSTHMLFGAEKAVLASHFYDLIDRNMKGDDVKMDAYKGSVLCVVNVASQ